MKYFNLVYCKHHPEDPRAFLYQLPKDADVKVGDKLCVHDRRGEHIVTAYYENWFCPEAETQMLCEANGGYYPPAKAVGTVRTITFTQEMVDKFADYGEENVSWEF